MKNSIFPWFLEQKRHSFKPTEIKDFSRLLRTDFQRRTFWGFRGLVNTLIVFKNLTSECGLATLKNETSLHCIQLPKENIFTDRWFLKKSTGSVWKTLVYMSWQPTEIRTFSLEKMTKQSFKSVAHKDRSTCTSLRVIETLNK